MPQRKTYSQLLEEIERLKQQAEDARRRELDEAIARLKAEIAFWGLTAQDLGLETAPSRHDKTAMPTPAPATEKKKKRKSRYTERPLAGPRG